jgi:prephenate dehydrogenase
MIIGIIGFGRFGKLTASILRKHADVLVFSRKRTEEDFKKAKKIGVKLVDFDVVAQSDIVIICTPISKTEAVIKKLAKLAKPGALVVDTCSVKVLPSEWLLRHLPDNVQILATHPMFGPVTSGFDLGKGTWKLDGLQIVLCPLRIKKSDLKRIGKFLKGLKLDVIITTPEDHDRQNAATLSLVHYLGRALWETGLREQRIFTPGYADLLKIYRHTVSDSWELFYDMHNYNPFAREMRSRFVSALTEIESRILEHGSSDKLQALRQSIDAIDSHIFRLLELRLGVVRRIGLEKEKRQLPTVDMSREEEMIKRRLGAGALSDEFIRDYFRLLFNESYKAQT